MSDKETTENLRQWCLGEGEGRLNDKSVEYFTFTEGGGGGDQAPRFPLDNTAMKRVLTFYKFRDDAPVDEGVTDADVIKVLCQEKVVMPHGDRELNEVEKKYIKETIESLREEEEA